MLDVGPDKFTAATGMNPTNLLNSRRLNREYTFSELKVIATRLFRTFKNNKKFWRSKIGKDIESALANDAFIQGRPAPIVQLHSMVQALGGRISPEVADREVAKKSMPYPQRFELTRHRFVPIKFVRPVLRGFVNSGLITAKDCRELESEWKDGYRKQSPWFHVRIGAQAKRAGITVPFLAECLGIKDSAKSGRSEQVREYLNGTKSYAALPFAPFAYLISDSKKEAERWIDNARSEIMTDIRLRMLQKCNPEIYAERLLWGVGYHELEDYTVSGVKKLEISGSGPLKGRGDEIIVSIRSAGQKKLVQPVKNWLARSSARTVKGFYRQTLRNNTTKETLLALGVGSNVFMNYRLGADVPTLDKLKANAATAKHDLLAACEIDWYREYPKKLRAWNYPDLARVLYTLSAQYSEEPIGFIRSRTKKNVKKNQERMTEVLRTGRLPKDELTSLLNDLGYKKTDPTRVFIELVNQHACISVALSKWIVKMKRTKKTKKVAQSFNAARKFYESTSPEQNNEDEDIEKLLKQKYRKERTKPLQQEEQTLRLLRTIPGVTETEILECGNTVEKAEISRFIKSCGAVLKSDGITPSFFMHLVEASRQGVAIVPTETFSDAYRNGRFAPAMSPTLFIILSSHSDNQLQARQKKLRAAIAAKYKLAGVEPTRARVDLAFYGLQISDLSCRYHDVLRALSDQPRKKDAAKVQAVCAEIQSLGIQRLQKSTEEFLRLHRGSNIVPLMKLYTSSGRGKQEHRREQTGVHPLSESFYLKGERVPTYPRLVAMVDAVGLEYAPDWEIAWHFAYARLADTRMSKLARFFNTGLMSGNIPSKDNSNNFNGAQQSGVNQNDIERRLLLDLATPHGYNLKAIGHAYTRMFKEGNLKPEMFEWYISSLGYTARSKRTHLLAAANSLEFDIVSFATQILSTSRAILRDHCKGLSYLTEFATIDQPKLAAKFNLEDHKPDWLTLNRKGDRTCALETIRLLAGITLEELLIVDMHLNLISNIARKPDLESKLKYLALASKRGVSFDHESLNGSFGSDGASIGILTAHLGIDFLPSLLKFQYPDQALTFLVNRLLKRAKSILPEGMSLKQHINSLSKEQRRKLDHRSALVGCFDK